LNKSISKPETKAKIEESNHIIIPIPKIRMRIPMRIFPSEKDLNARYNPTTTE
jgi:hypothetical protein